MSAAGGRTRRGVLTLGAMAGCHTVAPRTLWLPAHCAEPTRIERARLLSLPVDKEAFAMGAMAGDVTDTQAVLWTRVDRAAGRWTAEDALGLLVLALEGDASRVAWEGPVAMDEDGFALHEVTGLTAGVRHRYAFVRTRGGRAVSRGAGGRFRAAVSSDSEETITFGGTSCTSAQFGHDFDTLRRAALCGELDFFVHAGDHVYADEARTLDGYRAVYARTFARRGMRALHESAGLYVTWDDHELANNWDGETVDPTRLAAARRAFLEHHAWRGGWRAPRRMYERFRWGRAVELFVLDARGERRPSTRRGPDARYLSLEQEQWLIEGLRSSSARFKCVVNSVPITRFGGLFALGIADRWEGYPAQRQRVLEATRGIDGLWWLSGDFHLGCVGRVEPRGPDARTREVLMGPGGQLPNPMASLLEAPQFEFATSECNWARFDADPRGGTLRVSVINEEGRTLFSRGYSG